MSKSSHEKRRSDRRKVLSGYPKETPFSTIEDVDSYIGGERIQCLLCGKQYKSLGRHLVTVHSLTAEDYKEKYGIPFGRGLTSGNTHDQYVAIGIKNYQNTGDERNREFLKKARDNRSSFKPRLSPTVLKQRIDRIKSVCSATPVQKICPVCGVVFFADGALAFKNPLPCPAHRADAIRKADGMSEKSKKRIREWVGRNRERSADYQKARNWWGWQRNPFPLLDYVKKWGANLRIMDELIAEAEKRDMERAG